MGVNGERGGLGIGERTQGRHGEGAGLRKGWGLGEQSRPRQAPLPIVSVAGYLIKSCQSDCNFIANVPVSHWYLHLNLVAGAPKALPTASQPDVALQPLGQSVTFC